VLLKYTLSVVCNFFCCFQLLEPKQFADKLVTNRLRNDLYCVEWGVKLYSLTHSLRIAPLTINLTFYSDINRRW